MQALARFSGRKYLATRAKYCVSYQDAQGKDERGDGFRRKAGGTAQGARVSAVGTGGAGEPVAPHAGLLAYYESQSEHPPTAHLPGIARALGVTTDELLGLVAVKATARQKDSRLQRRMQEIEKLAAQRSARTKATPAGAGVGGGLLSFKYCFQRNLASLAVRIFVTLQNNSHWPLRINVKEAGLQW